MRPPIATVFLLVRLYPFLTYLYEIFLVSIKNFRRGNIAEGEGSDKTMYITGNPIQNSLFIQFIDSSIHIHIGMITGL